MVDRVARAGLFSMSEVRDMLEQGVLDLDLPEEEPTPMPLSKLGKLDPKALVDAVSSLDSSTSLRTVAASLGIDPSLLCRPLSYGQADRYACKLGLHPAEVWGAAWWRAEAEDGD